MPANAIRRSDDKAKEKYNYLSSKLEKMSINLNLPKFGECGKLAAYQEEDLAYLPTFTTNMITLSHLDERNILSSNENEQLSKTNIKKARAEKRRIIANISDDELFTDNIMNKDEHLENKNLDEEILSSIQSLLPEVVSKSQKPFNQMSANIIKNLIDKLDISEKNKQWLNAQIDGGIFDSNIFMRDIKNALNKSLKNGDGI